jgi:hypothetical protein
MVISKEALGRLEVAISNRVNCELVPVLRISEESQEEQDGYCLASITFMGEYFGFSDQSLDVAKSELIKNVLEWSTSKMEKLALLEQKRKDKEFLLNLISTCE